MLSGSPDSNRLEEQFGAEIRTNIARKLLPVEIVEDQLQEEESEEPLGPLQGCALQ